jgi:hypothetical protein
MPPIVQRLRDAAAAIREDCVSMRELEQAHGPAVLGTLLLLPAMRLVTLMRWTT